MKITRREMLLGAAALAAVLAGAAWYIVDSKSDAYTSKAAEIEKLKQQISFHENAIKMQENWLGELNALQEDLRVFDSNQRSVAPELMKTIKAISDRHGLDITRNSPRSEKPTGDLFELGINCTWQGDLDAMVGFLTDLQQQGLRYDVRSLNVKPVGKGTGKLGGNMLIMCAYTKKPNAARN
ncbi:MAG: hypothetical protein HKP10_06510 [Kiritimatiellales bacterium]|nr:hypothetical protein [Pontiella sp.]NNJ70924.1 hypothetical protein [Kiritimatiellales bacterium]